MITAIGTGHPGGVRASTKARYHKVCVMTDADVDGAHIRTLVLTFLFREMPELIEAGYVFIAKPPLYRMRNGKQQVYIEKETELEEVLLRDKLERMEVSDKGGSPFAVTHARWQRFTRKLKEYEGWASALRAEYGNDVINFLEASQLLDEGVTDADRAAATIRAETPEEEPLGLELVSEDAAELEVRVVERRTGSAATYRLRRELFANPEYENLARVHAELEKLAGTPPFDIRLGKREARALSFEELRRAVVDTAKEDVQELVRFKGLGEMNPDQLYDTTMDPEQRTLQRVTIEDASAADQIFSMLMGEKVEPRRAFIESNAKDVTNLDV